MERTGQTTSVAGDEEAESGVAERSVEVDQEMVRVEAIDDIALEQGLVIVFSVSVVEDDVTMATMDTTIAHIMNQQEDIKIKSSMCCNLIRPRVTLLTSNGRQIYIRAPFWAREYLMESSRSPPSNGSSLISEFYLVWPQSQKQGAASPVLGQWACNFVWDPGPCGAHVGCTPIWNKVDLYRQDQQPTERCIDR
uniref:Retrotransposon protein, putative, Ty3-gypsy sub-class n=2 Tax=Oryza sativa subsp. japonica TaxID=39947 RepID=Q10JN5_ORYSJ|nr:retrotransposon protein, putative, Ty3-gypsy sub-class [Oryza sativa Japonica Group]ABF96593.1 retrotransposon, putative, centromere-specific [Oryza sativa Japonica Group]